MSLLHNLEIQVSYLDESSKGITIDIKFGKSDIRNM